MAHAISFPLLLAGKRSQDFGWRFAGLMGGDDGFDCFDADYNASSIKPVLNVATARRPFQVIGATIGSVLVFVVNHLKAEWVRYIGYGDKAVDKQSPHFSANDKLDLAVSVGCDVSFEKAGASISLAHSVYDSAETSYATKGAGFVSRTSRNALPRFVGKAVNVDGLDFDPEQSLNGSFDIELNWLSRSGLGEPRDQVSIVAVDAQLATREASLEAATMVGNASKPSHSEIVRNLVAPFVAGHGEPSFHRYLSKDQYEGKPFNLKGQASPLTLTGKEM